MEGRFRSESRADEEGVAWRRGDDEVASRQEEWIERARERKKKKGREKTRFGQARSVVQLLQWA